MLADRPSRLYDSANSQSIYMNGLLCVQTCRWEKFAKDIANEASEAE